MVTSGGRRPVSPVTEASPGRLGVLAMAYGTPEGPEQIEAYYTHIRHGHPPSAGQLAELEGRYRAIGGRSPLTEITRAQAAALRTELIAAGQADVVVELGFKHAAPFIEEGVAKLLSAGADRIVAVVLAPHYSRGSVGEYEQRVRAAAEAAARTPELTIVPDWHLAPAYIELLASSLEQALASLPPDRRGRVHVLFTAHSLPLKVLSDGDPYPHQLRETAVAVAQAAGVERWSVGWQSAGRTTDRWIGPDVLQVLDALRGEVDAVVVCAAGFVADHLEVLYDLDIEARGRAEQLGLAFARTASPNDSPLLARALAGAVLERLAEPVE